MTHFNTLSSAALAFVAAWAPVSASAAATDEATTSKTETAAEAKDEHPDADLQPKSDAILNKGHRVGENAEFKPGKGLTLKSENGRFKLSTRVRAQFLYYGYGDHTGDEVEREQSFSLRRGRVVFSGHTFNKHNKFKLELAFSPRDLSMKEDVPGKGAVPHRTPVLTWYLEFDYLRDLTLRIGQYKVPFSRQRVISSGNQQLVDRSRVNGEFNLDRDVGIDIRSKDLFGLGGRLRYYAGIYMGEGRDTFQGSDPHFFYLGRIEILPFGKFKDYSEADFNRLRKPRLSLGGAYAFVDNAERNRGILGKFPADGGTTDYHHVTADFMFKYAGFSASGEFHWRKGERNPGDNTEIGLVLDPMTNMEVEAEVPVAIEDPRNGLGWFVQAGYLIPRAPIEIAARYSSIRGLGDDTSLGDEDEAGLALSWYAARHPLKLQADYHRIWRDGDFALAGNQFRIQAQVSF